MVVGGRATSGAVQGADGLIYEVGSQGVGFQRRGTIEGGRREVDATRRDATFWFQSRGPRFGRWREGAPNLNMILSFSKQYCFAT